MHQPPPAWVGVMASDSAHHQERVQGLHPPSCVSHQSEPNAPRRTSSTTTTIEHQSQSRHMRSLPVQEVRQSTRQICTVPSMPDQVEVERSPRKVAASWTKRTLFAIATFATTIFGNDRKLQCHLQQRRHVQATSKAKAKATPGPTSNTSAAPQTQWTSFDDMELHMDHLTEEEEQVEVMQIMIQESPIRALQMGNSQLDVERLGPTTQATRRIVRGWSCRQIRSDGTDSSSWE